MEKYPFPFIVSINISPGGIPKRPIDRAEITFDGLSGDGRAHDKHRKPERALSLLDEEIIEALRAEGYPVSPGTLGENLTVRHLHVQHLPPGTRLRFSSGAEIELVEPRKPCFVLDAVHPDLQSAVVGRIGYLARVVKGGALCCGEEIVIEAVPCPMSVI
jgi:MOSC domain-containing protein YiiM